MSGLALRLLIAIAAGAAVVIRIAEVQPSNRRSAPPAADERDGRADPAARP